MHWGPNVHDIHKCKQWAIKSLLWKEKTVLCLASGAHPSLFCRSRPMQSHAIYRNLLEDFILLIIPEGCIMKTDVKWIFCCLASRSISLFSNSLEPVCPVFPPSPPLGTHSWGKAVNQTSMNAVGRSGCDCSNSIPTPLQILKLQKFLWAAICSFSKWGDDDDRSTPWCKTE